MRGEGGRARGVGGPVSLVSQREVERGRESVALVGSIGLPSCRLHRVATEAISARTITGPGRSAVAPAGRARCD